MYNKKLSDSLFGWILVFYIACLIISFWAMGGNPHAYLNERGALDRWSLVAIIGPVAGMIIVYILRSIDHKKMKNKAGCSWLVGFILASIVVVAFCKLPEKLWFIDLYYLYWFPAMFLTLSGVVNPEAEPEPQAPKKQKKDKISYVESSGPCDLTSSSGCV